MRSGKGCCPRWLAADEPRRPQNVIKTDWNMEWRPLAWSLAVFLACFWLPVGRARFDGTLAFLHSGSI